MVLFAIVCLLASSPPLMLCCILPAGRPTVKCHRPLFVIFFGQLSVYYLSNLKEKHSYRLDIYRMLHTIYLLPRKMLEAEALLPPQLHVAGIGDVDSLEAYFHRLLLLDVQARRGRTT